jgi:hypothetical protein
VLSAPEVKPTGCPSDQQFQTNSETVYFLRNELNKLETERILLATKDTVSTHGTLIIGFRFNPWFSSPIFC